LHANNKAMRKDRVHTNVVERSKKCSKVTLSEEDFGMPSSKNVQTI
jgi:hypothetical protein